VGEQLIERGRDLLGRSPLHGRRGLVNDLHCVPYRGVHACQCREALAGLDVYYRAAAPRRSNRGDDKSSLLWYLLAGSAYAEEQLPTRQPFGEALRDTAHAAERSAQQLSIVSIEKSFV